MNPGVSGGKRRTWVPVVIKIENKMASTEIAECIMGDIITQLQLHKPTADQPI